MQQDSDSGRGIGAGDHRKDSGVTRPDPDLPQGAGQGPAEAPPKVSGVTAAKKDLSGAPDDEVLAGVHKTGPGPDGGASH